ncbi:MAG: HNH endonuclease [Gallionellaceae bacterium]|nr:HNH endonuclease [Gallionellaceae bacterium]
MGRKADWGKICPYCISNPADTVDHIFPQFLGGNKTIWACQSCNSLFGHSFEAAVHRDTTPLASMLALCGLRLSRPAVWKKALEDEDGYHLDFDGGQRLLKPSQPIVQKDTQTGSLRVTGDKRRVTAIANGFLRKYPSATIKHTDLTKQVPSPDNFTHALTIGTEIRRLAVKMCVALIKYSYPTLDVIDDRVRAFLLGNAVAEIPVRLAYYDYAVLHELRKPLSHWVYVEGSRQKGAYGVVQLFGCIQLYVVLNRNYDTPAFAFFASLDQPEWKERFEEPGLLNLWEAAKIITTEEQTLGVRGWFNSLNAQVKDAFGTNKYLF